MGHLWSVQDTLHIQWLSGKIKFLVVKQSLTVGLNGKNNLKLSCDYTFKVISWKAKIICVADILAPPFLQGDLSILARCSLFLGEHRPALRGVKEITLNSS